MKKPLFTIMMLLLAVPVLFTGCSKSDLNDKASTPDENLTKSGYNAFGGTHLVANLAEFKGDNYGTVTVSNDASKLYVKYTVTKSGWRIKSLVLFAGLENELPGRTAETPSTANPDGTGLFWMFMEKEKYTDMYYPVNYDNILFKDEVTTYTLKGDLPSRPDCFLVVAMAELEHASGKKIYAWGKSLLKSDADGYWLKYCKQTYPQRCETAYAFGGDHAISFFTMPCANAHFWGWTNKIKDAGKWTWPIYAGTGQWHIQKVTKVGTLRGTYENGKVTVTYDLDAGFKLSGTSLYIGNNKLPLKNGRFLTAPGLFPYEHDNATGTKDTYEIKNISLPFYIAAHADVSWSGGGR